MDLSAAVSFVWKLSAVQYSERKRERVDADPEKFARAGVFSPRQMGFNLLNAI